MKKLRIAAAILYVVGLVFGLLETWYFGWNMFPKTNAEYVCDTIASNMTTAGIVIIICYTIYSTELEIFKLKQKHGI